MLNNQSMYSTSVSENSFSQYFNPVFGQYFLISLKYRFNSTQERFFMSSFDTEIKQVSTAGEFGKRQKPLADGRLSLYLDFYPPISDPVTGQKKRREFLHLHIREKPKGSLRRQHNSDTLFVAEQIRLERENALLNDYSGINVPLVAVCNVPPVAQRNVPPQKWLQ